MKVGNKVKVYNVIGTDYVVATLVAITRETASIKYRYLPGIFTFDRSLVKSL